MEIKIGDKVVLKKATSTLAHYFPSGTILTVVGESYRGYDFEDEAGHGLYETGLMDYDVYFEKVEG